MPDIASHHQSAQNRSKSGHGGLGMFGLLIVFAPAAAADHPHAVPLDPHHGCHTAMRITAWDYKCICASPPSRRQKGRGGSWSSNTRIRERSKDKQGDDLAMESYEIFDNLWDRPALGTCPIMPSKMLGTDVIAQVTSVGLPSRAQIGFLPVRKSTRTS